MSNAILEGYWKGREKNKCPACFNGFLYTNWDSSYGMWRVSCTNCNYSKLYHNRRRNGKRESPT